MFAKEGWSQPPDRACEDQITPPDPGRHSAIRYCLHPENCNNAAILCAYQQIEVRNQRETLSRPHLTKLPPRSWRNALHRDPEKNVCHKINRQTDPANA